MTIQDALNILAEKLMSWLEAGIAILPNLAVAILLVAGGWFLSRGVGTVARRAFGRITKHRTLARLFALVLQLVVLGAITFVALGLLGLDRAVSSLLAGVGILGFALSFAFRDMAANFMSGVVMAVRRPFRVDDVVELNGMQGVVQEINLRETLVRAFDGRQIILPNRLVFEDPIINFTRTHDRRVEIPVGVGYDDDLEAVIQTAIEACEGVAGRMANRPVEALVTGFGNSAIDVTVRFWVHFPQGGMADYLEARSQAIRAIKKAFDAADISIPYPIRTLDLPAGFEPTGASPSLRLLRSSRA